MKSSVNFHCCQIKKDKIKSIAHICEQQIKQSIFGQSIMFNALATAQIPELLEGTVNKAGC